MTSIDIYLKDSSVSWSNVVKGGVATRNTTTGYGLVKSVGTSWSS
jgi:hypothetical protein